MYKLLLYEALKYSKSVYGKFSLYYTEGAMKMYGIESIVSSIYRFGEIGCDFLCNIVYIA